MLWEQARRLAAVVTTSACCAGPRRPRRPPPSCARACASSISPRCAARRPISSGARLAEARRAAARLLAEQDADLINVYQPLSGYGVLASSIGRRPALALQLPVAGAARVPLAPANDGASPRGRDRRRRHWPRCGWRSARACAGPTRIHVMSDFSVSLLWKLYRIPAERIVKIPGGVDVERFQPAADRRQVRAGLGLPLDSPLLLTVRNLEARMGLDTLLAAMVRLGAPVARASVLIGGAGSLREALERQVGQLGLDKHVTFLGFVPDAELPRYYQAADVFVLPTRELEGFGLVTVEALACGTPVLGTPVGATPELLEIARPLAGLQRCHRRGDGRRYWRASSTGSPAIPGGGAPARGLPSSRRVAVRLGARGRTISSGALRDVSSDVRLTEASPAACEASGGVLLPSRLLYTASAYRACPRCGTRRVVVLPAATEVRREYEQRYQRRFPPAQIAGARRAMLQSVLAHVGSLARARSPARRRLWRRPSRGGGARRRLARRRHRSVARGLRDAGAAGPVVQADAGALPFAGGHVRCAHAGQRARSDPASADGDAGSGSRAATRRAPRRAGSQRRLPRPVAAGCSPARPAGPLARLGCLPDPTPLRVPARGRAPPRRARRLRRADAANSALAAAAPDDAYAAGEYRAADRAPAHRGARGTAREVSGGRWLVGPSIELYARRRGGAAVIRVDARDHAPDAGRLVGEHGADDRGPRPRRLPVHARARPRVRAAVLDDARRRGCRIVEIARARPRGAAPPRPGRAGASSGGCFRRVRPAHRAHPHVEGGIHRPPGGAARAACPW